MSIQTLSLVLRKPLALGLTHGLKGASPLLTTGRVSRLAIPRWSQSNDFHGIRFKATKSKETSTPTPTPVPTPTPTPTATDTPAPTPTPVSTATPAPEQKKKKKKRRRKKKSAAKEKPSADQEQKPSSNQEQQKRKPRGLSPEELKTYLESFFSQYAGFVYDPIEPYVDEFYRMTNEFGWSFISDEFREAWQNLNKDDILKFNPSPARPKKPELNPGSKKKKKMFPAFIPGPRTQDELRAHFIAYFARCPSVVIDPPAATDPPVVEYPPFDYDPSKPYLEEFRRMIACTGWEQESTEYIKAEQEFRQATFKQFCDIYGLDPEDPKVWRNLICVLDVKGVPDTEEGYIEWIRTQYINICDLVDHPVTNIPIKLFETEEDLSKYSRNPDDKKIFPLYDRGLLHHLLRCIIVPRKPKKAKS